MEWTDEGFLLSAQPHGETSSVVTVLTASRGRHAGLVAGGQSRTKSPLLQPGNRVKMTWRSRNPDNLGFFSLELERSTVAPWLGEPEVLGLIASAVSVIEASLPERQAMPALYKGMEALFSLENQELWGPSYVRWELGILEALGYGLDLSCCALSGAKEGLAYISPRTGRAVTALAAQPYIEKLLPLPGFLCGANDWDEEDVLKGLELTGHFLAHHVFVNPQSRRLVPIDGMLPLARQRAAVFYRKKAEKTLAVA